MSEGPDHALILQFSADNAKMLRAFETAVAKVDKHSDAIERRSRKMAHEVEDAFGAPKIGKALERVFSSARLGVLEEGSAKLRIFGSALEPLGVVGLAAAAGVAAFGLSMERTEKAVEFAANIAKLSETIGVSTDFIQEFNFAAHQNEIDVGQADEALKKFNVTLGLVQSGLAKKMQVNAFKAVGLTPDDLRRYRDAGQLFPELARRISAIGNAAEEAAIARRLGIEELIPLLKQGGDGFDVLAQKARDLGIVMDRDTIERATEAKKKLTELDDVMKAKSNVTFAEFAGTLIAVKQAFLDAETAVLRFLAAITGTTPAEERIRNLKGQLDDLARRHVENSPAGKVLAENLRAQLAQAEAKVAARKAAEPPSAKQKAARELVPPTAPKGAKSDPTLGFDRSAQEAYNAGLKALTQAQAALLIDVQARAVAEKAAVFHDLASKIGELDLEEEKIRQAKNDRHRAEQLALIEKAKTEQRNAAHARVEEIERASAEEVRRQALQMTQQQLDGEARLLELSGELTFSEQLRQRYALELVDLAYQRTKNELEGVIASKLASDADRKMAQLKLDQLNAQHPLEQEGARRNGSEPARAVGGIVAGIKRQTNAADDARAMYAEIERLRQADKISEAEAAQAKAAVNQQYHEARLQQASSFFGDLASLSQSSNKTLAAIGKAAAIAQATIDGILAVQKALASAPPPYNFILAGAAGVAAAVNVAKIAGLADGGWVDGPGGPRDDRVLRRLSRSEFVVNAEAARRNGPLLEALNTGRDLRGFLPTPVIPRTALPSSATPRGGDVHLHYEPKITNPDPDLMALMTRQGREFRGHLNRMIANREIKLA